LKLQKTVKYRYDRLEMCDPNNSPVALVDEILVETFSEVLDVISKVLIKKQEHSSAKFDEYLNILLPLLIIDLIVSIVVVISSRINYLN